MHWRPPSVFVVAAVLVSISAFLLTPGAAAKADPKLPACDQAHKLYKAGKLYDVLGLTKRATKKEIRR